MRTATPLGLSAARRAEYGCVLTFANDDGKRLVLHRKGAPTAIVGPMLDEALEYDPSFRLLTYSTPETIFTDLQGARENSNGEMGFKWEAPESKILGRVGRPEMLHPSLWSSYADGTRFSRRRSA